MQYSLTAQQLCMKQMKLDSEFHQILRSFSPQPISRFNYQNKQPKSTHKLPQLIKQEIHPEIQQIQIPLVAKQTKILKSTYSPTAQKRGKPFKDILLIKSIYDDYEYVQ